ncbi:MAG: NAD(P)/FAD-dependent oxidoreductase [Bacteroidales bacterium]|nr:NAD(P)/FAD-dependent oxidoreductase [Bacteroidales bacterium]
MKSSYQLMRDTLSSNFSDNDRYAMIIIGAGLSGLACGLMWLRHFPGMKTLIIEKNSYPGGYSTAYEKGGYVFETSQLFPDIVDILDYLGIELSLKRYENNFMRRLVVDGDHVDEYRIPAGAENFTRYLIEKFPGDADKISSLMAYSVDLFKQVRKLKANATMKDNIATVFRAPKVIANLNRTYSGLLDKFRITNPKLREVMETFTSFSGVPSDRASAILATGAMLSSMTKCYRPLGFFDEYPAKLALKFQSLGGEIIFNSEVEKIEVEDGAVTGVKITDSQSPLKAEKVITTIDPMVAMRKLVGDENLPQEYVQKLQNTIMSPSSFNVALGLDDYIDMKKLDLDYPYNVVSTGLGTAEKLFNAFLAGNHGFSKDCFHAAVICPSLTTGSKNTVTIRSTPWALNGWKDLRESNYEAYRVEKEKWADFLIDIAEKYFIPGLRKHIVVKDIATPATYARYSGSPTGSIYDIASLVTQFGPKRIPMKTPVRNLFQPKFAHGLYGTMMGAVQVVDLISNRKFNNGNSLFIPPGKSSVPS